MKKKEEEAWRLTSLRTKKKTKLKKQRIKKAVPTSSPSKNSKGVRIKVERRKNKVVTVVSGLEIQRKNW